MSVLLRIAYDGTDFHGYARQVTPEGADRVRTVQGELERALAVIFKQPVATRGASRTDAGVHAEGQLVAFDPPFEIADDGIALGVSSELPPDVAITAVWREEGEGGAPVEPRHHNRGKHYRYLIRSNPLRDPATRRNCWHLARGLDVAAMRTGAEHFVGTHDFASFRATDCQARTTERTITAVEIETAAVIVGTHGDPGKLPDFRPAWLGESPDLVTVHVHGTAFLKNMVRIMVGTLVEVGRGQRDASSVAEALAARSRPAAGMTAPACGLTLVEVVWPRGG